MDSFQNLTDSKELWACSAQDKPTREHARCAVSEINQQCPKGGKETNQPVGEIKSDYTNTGIILRRSMFSKFFKVLSPILLVCPEQTMSDEEVNILVLAPEI